jgi:hypothetical protein
VIDSNFTSSKTENNWSQIFKDGRDSRLFSPPSDSPYEDNGVPDHVFQKLSEKFEIIVEQAEWNEIEIVSYLDCVKYKRACVSLFPKKSNTIFITFLFQSHIILFIYSRFIRTLFLSFHLFSNSILFSDY